LQMGMTTKRQEVTQLILVDTSVLIDYLKDLTTQKTKLFANILQNKWAYGISQFTYQEVLQGARDEKEFKLLDRYLSNQKIYYLPEDVSVYRTAAQTYYMLRRSGITLRNTIDVLIALTAVSHGLLLLHDDRDFENMKQFMDGLHMMEAQDL